MHHSKGNLVVHAAGYKLWVYAPSRKGLPTSGGENADTDDKLIEKSIRVRSSDGSKRPRLWWGE